MAFYICAAFIGLAVGCTLPVVVLFAVLLATSIVVMAHGIWQGLTIGEILWAGLMCQLFIEAGYATSLMARAVLVHRRRRAALEDASHVAMRGKQR